jgi:hypothetical protein
MRARLRQPVMSGDRKSLLLASGDRLLGFRRRWAAWTIEALANGPIANLPPTSVTLTQ